MTSEVGNTAIVSGLAPNGSSITFVDHNPAPTDEPVVDPVYPSHYTKDEPYEVLEDDPTTLELIQNFQNSRDQSLQDPNATAPYTRKVVKGKETYNFYNSPNFSANSKNRYPTEKSSGSTSSEKATPNFVMINRAAIQNHCGNAEEMKSFRYTNSVKNMNYARSESFPTEYRDKYVKKLRNEFKHEYNLGPSAFAIHRPDKRMTFSSNTKCSSQVSAENCLAKSLNRAKAISYTGPHSGVNYVSGITQQTRSLSAQNHKINLAAKKLKSKVRERHIQLFPKIDKIRLNDYAAAVQNNNGNYVRSQHIANKMHSSFELGDPNRFWKMKQFKKIGSTGASLREPVHC